MKKQLQKIILVAAAMGLGLSVNAQKTTSSFESLTLAPDSYFNGSTQPLGTTFTDGNAIFKNEYDTSYGGYWASGWAYSSIVDTTTAGFGNLYGAKPGSGYAHSANYAVGQQSARIILKGAALGKVVSGFYVTNGTFAYLSMKDGDTYGKVFGSTKDAHGNVDGTNGADWFKLTVRKYYNGVKAADTVDFYLADFRFSNNAKDYIVKDWRWVDLTSLGNVDSLEFSLSSSDNGQYGMNTPAFFCIDNLVTTQTIDPAPVSTFDLFTLAPGSYFNGSTKPLGTNIIDGNAIFPNRYDTSYGGYWAEGWAYSNVKDTVTAGYTNLYAARAGTGNAGSENYGVGQNNAAIKIKTTLDKKSVKGMFITNSTYAALSMQYGDGPGGFAKKFGSKTSHSGTVDGTDGKDYFLLTIKKYENGTLSTDSVDFYLADYRSADTTQHYIVKNWSYVDLMSLGAVDSLKFILRSSDNSFGYMNTPAFFCMDNLETIQCTCVGISELDKQAVSLNLFPNPATDILNVNINAAEVNEALVNIYDALGKLVYTSKITGPVAQISLTSLPAGIYHLNVVGNSLSTSKSFIKQ